MMTPLQELASTLHKLQQSRLLCDMVLIADDAPTYVHSVLLAAASPSLCKVFSSLDRERFGASYRYRIQIPGCTKSAVDIVVQMIYTGWLQLPEDFDRYCDFVKLRSVCDALGIERGPLNEANISEKRCVLNLPLCLRILII